MIKAYRLYTGSDGHSHVEVGTVSEDQFTEAETISFRETPAHSFYDWHTAPIEQYVITISGTLEFTIFSGETFKVKPGDILIALDTTGSGHKWQLIDDEPWKRAYVVFKRGAKINFVAE